MIAALIAAVMAAQPPADLREQVREAWTEGNLEAAGEAARALLDHPETVMGDGATLSFIAALDASADGRRAEAAYRAWAAFRYETACGRTLSHSARDAARHFSAPPGRLPATDRFHLALGDPAPGASCGQSYLTGLESRGPARGEGEAAIALTRAWWSSSGRLRRLSVLFDYPEGEAGDAVDRLPRDLHHPTGVTHREHVIVLAPCQTYRDRSGEPVEICRPGYAPDSP
jgi:hypothetical protein